MKLEKILLINFRSYEKQEFNFKDGVNLILGKNGTGKTNLLESVLFSSTTASHRTSNNRLLIRRGAPAMKVSSEIYGLEGKFRIHLTSAVSGGTNALLNSTRVNNGKILEVFPAVMFAPEDIEIIKGSRSGIRRMININICQINGLYINLLLKYRKVLRERNALLKQNSRGSSLEAWTGLLKKYTQEIDTHRIEFLEKINRHAARISPVFGLNENLNLSYHPSGYTDTAQGRDEEAGFTTWGAHRAGFSFKLGTRDLREEGSRGEARISALIYRLILRDILRDETGKEPILLMDDAFSELDAEKRKLIAENFRGGQVLFTATERPEDIGECINVIKL